MNVFEGLDPRSLDLWIFGMNFFEGLDPRTPGSSEGTDFERFQTEGLVPLEEDPRIFPGSAGGAEDSVGVSFVSDHRVRP